LAAFSFRFPGIQKLPSNAQFTGHRCRTLSAYDSIYRLALKLRAVPVPLLATCFFRHFLFPFAESVPELPCLIFPPQCRAMSQQVRPQLLFKISMVRTVALSTNSPNRPSAQPLAEPRLSGAVLQRIFKGGCRPPP
jgi:hypothetical protein